MSLTRLLLRVCALLGLSFRFRVVVCLVSSSLMQLLMQLLLRALLSTGSYRTASLMSNGSY